MMTVLIILLAYPVANMVLNTITCVMMSYALGMKEDIIASFIFGQTLESVFYPLWIRVFGSAARLTVAIVVCTVRGRWYP